MKYCELQQPIKDLIEKLNDIKENDIIDDKYIIPLGFVSFNKATVINNLKFEYYLKIDDFSIHILFHNTGINCWVQCDIFKRASMFSNGLDYIDYELITFIKDSIKFVLKLEDE